MLDCHYDPCLSAAENLAVITEDDWEVTVLCEACREAIKTPTDQVEIWPEDVAVGSCIRCSKQVIDPDIESRLGQL